MAEYVVSSTLARLDDLLIHESKFLSGVEGQVKCLQTALRRMQGFLNDVDWRQDEGERQRRLLAKIRAAAYAAEDVVETYALKSESKRTEGAINGLERLSCIYTEQGESQIEEIATHISDLTSEIVQSGGRASSQGEGSSSLHERQRRSYPRIVEDIVVGIEKNIEELVTCLVEQNGKLVGINGEDGLGKTTLAKKVYHHSKVRCHFDHFAWVYFDPQFTLIDVCERILLALSSPTGKQRDEIFKLKEGELKSELGQLTGENKCLVAIDGILGIEGFDPVWAISSTMGRDCKIMFTSGDIRANDIVDSVLDLVHHPQFLNYGDSWELLQKIARSGRGCADFNIDTRMEELGKNMVNRCLGRPLAITMLGGILATKYSSNEWQMVQDNIESYLRRWEEMNRRESYTHEPYSVPFLTLSYLDLPTWLKPCLLYLSQFPGDYEINVNKLIRLWIAEGFVQPAPDTGDEEMLEDVAESYLNELILRRMVIVGEREASSRIKTCRLHRLMRDLCFSKAEYESLHEIINYRQGDQYSSSSTSRRLAIHLHGHSCQFPLDYIKSPNLRSLLCFYDYDFSDERWRLRKPIFDKLKLLRVLDLEGADIGEGNLLKDVGQLIYLRFLSLRHARVSTIPASIGKLRCLQTLDLLIEGTIMDVPNVIWKMERLRHLYLPEFCDAKTKLRLETLKNLRTLVNFPAQNCDVRDLFSMTNLRELTIRDPISIKNFAKFSKSLSIKLKHLKALSLDNSYNEDDREAAKSKDLRSMSFGDLKVPSI